MANVTLSIPDSILPDLEAALRERLGDAATGLNRRAVFALWVAQGVKPLVLAYRRRRDVATRVAAVETARVAVEQALATEQQARQDAEAAVASTLDTEIAGVS